MSFPASTFWKVAARKTKFAVGLGWICSTGTAVLGFFWDSDPAPESEPEFLCETAQAGYHIIQATECGMHIWRDSLKGTKPLFVNFEKYNERCEPPQGAVFTEIEAALQIPPREEYQQPVRYFTPDGGAVNKNDDFGKVVFLIEGGQWQWPPVKHGHRHALQVDDGRIVYLETRSLQPPVFFIDSLVMEDEAQALIDWSKPKFKDSAVLVMDGSSAKDTKKWRTSRDVRPEMGETPLIRTFERRAEQVSKLSRAHQEHMQILEYDLNGYYHAHDDATNLELYKEQDQLILEKQYGHFDRMITLFWYLNTVEEGGETIFPAADGTQWPEDMSACGAGLKVKPQQGSAIMWYNMNADGKLNRFALHAACPVTRGQKYAINAWIYNKERAVPPASWNNEHPVLKRLGRSGGAVDDGHRLLHTVSASARDVHIYWKSDRPDCGNQCEVFMISLDSNNNHGHSLNTFRTHVFVARDAKTGEYLDEYQVHATRVQRSWRWDIKESLSSKEAEL
ncbi:unnamed protein product [Amoebophrya sp. A25]|nr:unnamed protein product [Amoebophrya sp. A25]|eukprot:GSA25T00002362001.1